MDIVLRNLERQYQADPTDEQTMKRLLAAYRRLHQMEQPAQPELSEESIQDAMTQSGLGWAASIKFETQVYGRPERGEEQRKEYSWRIMFDWNPDIELAEINHFADLLGINPEQITISGGHEDVTRCSCGGCSRDIEDRIYIEIKVLGPLTSPVE